MANPLYNTSIRLFGLAAKIASRFSGKAKLFNDGRKTVWESLADFNKPNVVWFHAASLGEFEQGKPVMEKLKLDHPEINLVVSFFSPSGYEEQKDWPLATTCYLPLDTPANAKKFIERINPVLAVFIRYEFWANYLDELKLREIPTAVMAAQFRADQFLFKPLGSFLRHRVAKLDAIMVQYQSAQDLLLRFGFEEKKISICGDSRFDRVLETVSQAENIPEIEAFKGDAPLVILGSCYDPEVKFIEEAVHKYPNWKFLYAPHQVEEERIQNLLKKLPQPAARFSQYRGEETQLLVLDTIGKLASAYRYGDIAVIGGGYLDNIHNILEAAAFGLPIFFGPNHSGFPEAQVLLDLGLVHETEPKNKALATLSQLMENAELRSEYKIQLTAFVEQHAGATPCISNKLESLLKLS